MVELRSIATALLNRRSLSLKNCFRLSKQTPPPLHLWLFFILFLTLFLLSFKFLSLWFIFDDMLCIRSSLNNPLHLLFDRETYLTVLKIFYTPFLFIFFKLDWLFFKFHPVWYHVHNLFAAFCVGLISHKVYRIYLPRLESWIGTFIFLISYPIISNIGWITMRHYLWGSFLSLSSFYLFKRFELYRGLGLFLSSLFLYMAAVLSKEAFAPLPLIVLLLAKGGLKKRLLLSLPFFIAFGVYYGLRSYMIGGLGGYITPDTETSFMDVIKTLVLELNVFSKGVWGIPAIFMSSVFAALFVLDKKRALVIFALFLITLSPYFFLDITHFNEKWFVVFFPSKLMLPLFIFAAATALIFHSARNKRGVVKFLAPLLVVILFGLQISRANDSYGFISENAQFFQEISMEAMNKISKGENVILGDLSLGYVSNLYAIYEKMKWTGKGWGRLVMASSMDNLIVNSDFISEADSLFFNKEWYNFQRGKQFLTLRQGNISFPNTDGSIGKPQVKVENRGPFITVNVIDDRKGSFYAVLETNIFFLDSGLQDNNIRLYSAFLPRNKPITLGLLKNEKLYVYYREGNRFSEPLQIGF